MSKKAFQIRICLKISLLLHEKCLHPFRDLNPGPKRQKESKLGTKTTELQCHNNKFRKDYMNKTVVGGGDDNRVLCKIAWNPSHVR